MINVKKYRNMTKCIIPNTVQLSSKSFYNVFNGMTNLKTVSIPNCVTNMAYAYSYCNNLTTAVCGPNVTNMSGAYRNCTNLTTAVCGDNVTDMSVAYENCHSLTTAVCGDNVTNMSNAYWGCRSLTTAVCGPNVTNMFHAYENCRNLTTAVCGPNVTNMAYAYSDCTNIQGNLYIYHNKTSNVACCFNNKISANRLNIYVHSGSNTLGRLRSTNIQSIVGKEITWTDDTATNGCHYNTAYNIYIYPVANVEESRIANGDPDYMGNM